MSLSNDEARQVLGMIARGDNHHDVAAWFGVNQGRIDDVKKGLYGVVADTDGLPPKGAPGLKGRRLRGKVAKAIEALETGDSGAALAALKDGIEGFNKNT